MHHKNTPKASYQISASSYDAQRIKLKAIKDALHLCIRMILSDLPGDAKILCVGAGTGAELINLAQAFPQWTFTVVEPSSEMMKRCILQTEKLTLASRCTFHEGYLDTLKYDGLFDAATSILVSHFMVNENERIEYYSKIAKMMKHGGYMINADLSADMSNPNYKDQLKVWINMHDYAGMPSNVDSFGHKVALLPTENIESILLAGRFHKPILFFQALFIKAWYSRINSNAV